MSGQIPSPPGHNPGLNTIKGDDLPTVLTRLSETIQWCSQLELGAHPQTDLRSAAIYPYPFFAHGPKEIVKSVADKRHWRLQVKTPTPANSLANGRLLAYFPACNADDGYSSQLSNGFYDEGDAPPWDTWVAYIYESDRYEYLLSWIPQVYIELASYGAEVNALGCMARLDEQTEWHDKTGSLPKNLLTECGL